MDTHEHVYLDNNATTRMADEVIVAVNEANAHYGNASSMHEFGRDCAVAVASARKSIAGLVDCEPSDVVFTSGASESNNTVFNIFRDRIDQGAVRNRIVTTTIEHPSIVEMAKFLRSRGYVVDEVPVDATGMVRPETVEAALGDDVCLVSVMLGNNETGTIQPVAEISALAHAHGAYMHSDVTQAVGKIPVSMKDLGLDYLSLSAHKFYGPKGIGILAVKKDAPYLPFVHGGHQEGGRRAGTYNTPAIVGMGVAADLAREHLDEEHERLWHLREMLRVGLEERIEHIVVNGSREHCLPGTLDVSFPSAEGESILLYLDLNGVEVSTGSACATGSLEPSYVLLASGLDVELAHGSIRFSFGRYNTEEDVRYVLDTLPPIIKRLREMSTR